MGYRTYIGKIKKRDYNKIKSSQSIEEVYQFYQKAFDSTPEEYREWLEWSDVGIEELFCFGIDEGFNPPKKSTKPFFKNKTVQEHWGVDRDLYIVTPIFLKYINEKYTEKVKGFYRGLLKPFFNDKGKDYHPFLRSGELSDLTEEDKSNIYALINHIRSMAGAWGVCSLFQDFLPYNLETGDAVTNSNFYEYTIFELVRIYKTFDWKKDVMVFYGW